MAGGDAAGAIRHVPTASEDLVQKRCVAGLRADPIARCYYPEAPTSTGQLEHCVSELDPGASLAASDALGRESMSVFRGQAQRTSTGGWSWTCP
jgi:hypothetical protein